MEYLNEVKMRGVIGPIKISTVGDHRFARIALATNSLMKTAGKNCAAIINTQWHNVEAWESENLSLDNLETGTGVYIEGMIKTQQYTGADGITRSSTIIKADTLCIVDCSNGLVAPVEKN